LHPDDVVDSLDGRRALAEGPVHARARDSFFADRRDPGARLRVCRGTSCWLAGHRSESPLVPPDRAIQCAGYCDRSPVALQPDGSVKRMGSPAPLDPLPEIRSLARRAIVTERIARGDHHEFARAREAGVWRTLERALHGEPASVLQALEASGERGRGGAGFPTGAKWRHAARSPGAEKYVIANGDEGDPGSFIDRVLLESDPHAVLEGLALCAFAIGARHGIVYVRSEYPRAAERVERAIADARGAGLLGPSVSGSDFALDVRVARGEGSYVCGEETALIAALEGRRGEVRARPPYPTSQGLFGMPTVVNNVVSLATVPVILARGATFYRDYGVGKSRGTLPVQLAGNLRRGGLVEVAFGPSLRELLYDFGGGSASGRPLRAVQVGGPLGAYLPESQFDTPLDYEALAGIGALLGHGGVVAFDDAVDMARMARFAMRFCAHESCGKCTPCRIGSTRGAELIDRIMLGQERERNLRTLVDLCETMQHGSLCGLGGMTPFPVRSALEHFPEDFGAPRAH